MLILGLFLTVTNYGLPRAGNLKRYEHSNRVYDSRFCLRFDFGRLFEARRYRRYRQHRSSSHNDPSKGPFPGPRDRYGDAFGED